jgi:anthranilate phosphoribosyltransferase
MEIKDAIRKVADRGSLTEAEAHAAMGQVMDGQATPAQIAALITALRMKGETVEEIAGFARAMRERAQRITPSADALIDVVGTGGDRLSTFNISTTAAFVVAAAGGYVAKHGNRAVSRLSGAADVLEALGVQIQVSPEVVRSAIEDIGIGFMFAPLYHAAMKHAVAPRKEIGIRTVFNVLGPLTNPANANFLVVGTYDPALTEIMVQVLGEMGARRAFVVHGLDGLDEVSTVGVTRVSELRYGSVRTYTITPEELGLARSDSASIAGGPPEENAAITTAVLRGENGPRQEIVLANAAAALVAAEIAGDWRDGVALARRAIASGAAYEKLEALRAHTRAAVS